MDNPNGVTQVGFWASIAVAAETILFAASLIAGLAGGLGPTLSYVASVFLAPCVAGMMAAAYRLSPAALKIFGLLGLACALVYAPFSMSTYFLQLAVVAGNPLGYSPESLSLIAFVPGSATFALDMLGYVFLCFSTLWVAFTLLNPKDRALRVLCIIHGFLAVPTVAAPLMSSMYLSPGGQASTAGSWVNLFWCVLFAPIAVLFAAFFRRETSRQA